MLGSWFRIGAKLAKRPSRSDVAAANIRKAVKDGLEMWVSWERETKALYEGAYRDLINEGHVAAACQIEKLVLDVSEELATAEQYWLDKKASDYDIGEILAEQDKDRKTYRQKSVGI